VRLLGATGGQRIDTLAHDLVEASSRAGDIVQTEEIGSAMLTLRQFMFDRVYLGPHARAEHDRARGTVFRIVDDLVAQGRTADEIVSFVSGMTDRFALEYAQRLP
jgi:dGTPase